MIHIVDVDVIHFSVIDPWTKLTVDLRNKQHLCRPFRHFWFYNSHFQLFLYFSPFKIPCFRVCTIWVFIEWFRFRDHIDSHIGNVAFSQLPRLDMLMLLEHVLYVSFPARWNIKWYIHGILWLFIFSHILFSFISEWVVFLILSMSWTSIYMAFTKLDIPIVMY